MRLSGSSVPLRWTLGIPVPLSKHIGLQLLSLAVFVVLFTPLPWSPEKLTDIPLSTAGTLVSTSVNALLEDNIEHISCSIDYKFN